MHRSLLKCCGLLVGLAVLGMAQAGCETSPQATAEADMALGAVSLCTGCGQIKGSPVCCQPGQPSCQCYSRISMEKAVPA